MAFPESFDQLSQKARAIWAKSGDPEGYGLLAHMLDVAAVAEAILLRESPETTRWAATAFGFTLNELHRWIATLVGLHDFGKAIPGFQAKWPAGQAVDQGAGLDFSPPSTAVTLHDWASAALLREILAKRIPNRAWVLGVVQAVSAHHGYNLHHNEIRSGKPYSEHDVWREARAEIFTAYWETLRPQGKPQIDELSLAAVEWLAGLTSIADWVGSNQEWFPLIERAVFLTEHFSRARMLATKALDIIGWPKFGTLYTGGESVNALISRIIQRNGKVSARALQIEAGQLLSDVQGSALLLVEAPMGEGKTELAFLAYLRLQAANRHRGLYLALPTQATGDAAFDRTLIFLKAFATDMRLDLQLAHGGAIFAEHVFRLRDVYSEQGDDAVSSSTWFSQRRRALLSPYGVGTIDQALFATLNVKHHFVRLWGLANRVVVLDEVHAYDTYTSGLIEALLRWLKALDCSVVLMSATLPERRRNALLRAWGAEAVEELCPYPRLMLADARGMRSATFNCRPLPPIHIGAVAEDLDAISKKAQECLAGRGCGAVITNTVDRAQNLYRMLKSSLADDVELMLFHARYPADERSERERAVMACFGYNGKRPAKALLIATQVVEQSLDLDFDFLVTDLAPMDLILQRSGRLHRHERERPPMHRNAVLYVAGLQKERLPDLKETKWEYVYEPYILARTWALLSRETVLQPPHDIDRLVQMAYAESPEDLPPDIPQHARRFIESETYGKYLATVQNERLQSSDAAVDAYSEPQNAYVNKPRGNEKGDGLGIRNRTRLGDDGITVVPVHVTENGWRLLPHDLSFDSAQPIDDVMARRLVSRQVRLNRKAVAVELGKQEAPAGFVQHPWLLHLKPLLLTNGAAQLGTLRLCLDDELGIVYETTEPSPNDEEN